MEDRATPEITVVSRNYSTGLGIIRSLGAAGYTVDLIASVIKKGTSVIASSSRYVRRSTEIVSGKTQGDNGDELVREILKSAAGTGLKVVFPVDDYTAAVIDAHRTVLEDAGFILCLKTSSEYTVTELMEKTVQGELARRAGLLTPSERKISLRKDITVPRDIGYPCFVKPLQSFTGQKSEMKKCETREELIIHLDAMKSFYSDREVLVQEYLEIDREIDLSGICLDEEIIIPAIIKKTRIAKYHRGITMQGVLAPLDELEPVLENIKKLLRSLHYTGMFDMELNLCGDRIYFNEINLRSGGPNYSYFLNGVNLPDILVKELCGEGHSPEEEKVSEFGKSFIYEKVAWEDYMNGYMSRKELFQCIETSDVTLLSDSRDPAPGKIFGRRIRMSAAKHIIMRKLKRGDPHVIQK